MDQVAGLDLKAFIRALGSDAPAPGAGAAGATALGMAAACAAKAMAISARHAQDPDLAQVADRAREIALLALAGAEWDAEDYPAVLHHEPGAKTVLRQDGETALGLADALAVLIEAHASRVIPLLAGDLAAARALLAAFESIGRENLRELGNKD
jgi:hypothetical protein